MSRSAASASPRTALTHAVDLLARREHSCAELRGKLLRAGHEAGAVDDALARLQERGYLDDRRYAELFVRSRTARGQGPLRIRAGLRERGVEDGIAAQALDALDGDWLSLCEQARASRFGAPAPAGRPTWLRQARFLAGRGFSESQVRAVLRRAGRGEDDAGGG